MRSKYRPMADYYYTGPTYTTGVDPYSQPPLNSRLWIYFLQNYTGVKTVLKNSGVYTAHVLPTTEQVNDADAVYHGGHKNIVDDAEKTLIEASGVGGSFEAI